MEMPIFKVKLGSVQDRFSHIKGHEAKVAYERGASGISSEDDEEHNWEDEKSSVEKKKVDKDVAKAEEMRRQSLETLRETRKRKDGESTS